MDLIRVMLVDDNPTFLQIATRFLHHICPNEVIVVGTALGGKEALERAQDLRPQVIVLDLGMPGLNGLEIIPLLRAMLPKVGIIVLTLLDANSYRRAALAAGADALVPKSAMNAELLPTILQVMRKAWSDADTMEVIQ